MARKVQEMTVFILSCGEEYALLKRPNKGLLAGLWEFPNVCEKLDLPSAMAYLMGTEVAVRGIYRQVEKKHIFTHIEWKMTGFYFEIGSKCSDFVWMSRDEIDKKAALPTAFRQFWEDIGYV